MEEQQIQNMEQEIMQLRASLQALTSAFYKNNFSANQDFNKASSFNTTLKVPHYAVAPTTCQVGEVIEVGGKLKICSATNVFTTVGTQT